MDENLTYYIFVLLAVIVGFLIVKRVASCLIKSIVLALLAAALVLYYIYSHGGFQ